VRTKRDTKKRDAILEAIKSLLLEGKTFSEISVGEITRTAGTSRSTFYLHFKDKVDVIKDLIEDLVGELIDVAELANDDLARTNKDTLRMALVGLAQVYRKHVAFFSAISEVAGNNPEINERYRAMIEQAAFVRQKRVVQEQKEGKISGSLPPYVPLALTWMVERSISQNITTKSSKNVMKDKRAMKVIDALTEVIWAALYGINQNSPSAPN
jgi:TetR/AcrR family transcriptional regulator, ethionamide resistance regulator